METDDFRVGVLGAPGIRFRRWNGPADIPSMVDVNMAVRLAAGTEETVSLEGMTNQYTNLTNCDTARDLAIVELDRRIIGYIRVDWSDQTDGSRSYDLTCLLHPETLGQGIGSAMLAWGEARIREIAAGHETDRPRWLGQETWDTEASAGQLLARNGYGPVRTFYEMVRPNLDEIPAFEMPSGFGLRPIGPDDLRRVWEAEVEAIRDHWGGTDESDEAFARFAGDPHLDPSLFIVGVAGDDIAGVVRNFIDDAENARFRRRRGTLDSVSVRRPYRRRGLARALVLASLALLRDRGMTSAVLGVDAENPNAALPLYRSCGFEVRLSNTSWRKPLEPITEAPG